MLDTECISTTSLRIRNHWVARGALDTPPQPQATSSIKSHQRSQHPTISLGTPLTKNEEK